jgi:Protein of unknown function (DUF4019)
MGKFCTSALCAVLIISGVTFAQAAPEKAAEDSASQWLALVDAGDYAASWDTAAELFKNAVSKEQWTEKIKVARGPFGKLNSRKLKSAAYKTSLPGAPDGQYVVIQYDSSFEHKQSAVETITPMMDKDGQWRVSGYFIR